MYSIKCNGKVNCKDNVHCLCLGGESNEVDWLNGVI